MVQKFSDKKSRDTTHKGINISENQQLGNELHNPINRRFNKPKVHSSYRDIFGGADLRDMQLISK